MGECPRIRPCKHVPLCGRLAHCLFILVAMAVCPQTCMMKTTRCSAPRALSHRSNHSDSARFARKARAKRLLPHVWTFAKCPRIRPCKHVRLCGRLGQVTVKADCFAVSQLPQSPPPIRQSPRSAFAFAWLFVSYSVADQMSARRGVQARPGARPLDRL